MVQVNLTAPTDISKNTDAVPIEIVLTAPAPQTIQCITLTLLEEFTTWKDEDKETRMTNLQFVRCADESELRLDKLQICLTLS